MKSYTVTITTYFRRFEEWLKPMVAEIKRQRPEIEIIISINGEINKIFYEDYRKNIMIFMSNYPNVFPIFYPKFRGMARLWNQNIQLSTNDNVLCLEDDLTIHDGFFDEYEKYIEINSTFLINDSYSAISTTKQDMIDVGWFDERYLGLGHEDQEFTKKYNQIKGKLGSVSISTCGNLVSNLKLKHLIETEPRLVGSTLEKQFNRYSQFNREISDEIFNSSNKMTQYPYELFYLTNKEKL